MKSGLEILSDVLAERIGLVVDARRRAAIEFRLAPIVMANGMHDLNELAGSIALGQDPPLLGQVVDAMVTNETLFFRDRAPFEMFRSRMLPALLEARSAQRSLRVWSAACSSGQEAYSLAMILDEESRRLNGWRIDLLATDVSGTILKAARAGRYSQFEVQRGLSTNHLLRYFQRDSDNWTISPHLRAMVDFRHANLLSDFKRFGTFDVIFCRNVLMYMDVPRRRDVLKRMAASLPDDGYLVLGAAETIVGLSDEFMPHPEHPSIFIRCPAAQRRSLRLVASA